MSEKVSGIWILYLYISFIIECECNELEKSRPHLVVSDPSASFAVDRIVVQRPLQLDQLGISRPLLKVADSENTDSTLFSLIHWFSGEINAFSLTLRLFQ